MRALSLILFLVGTASAAEPTVQHWSVRGVTRDALVVAPKNAKDKPSPLVFVFHGHGGTMRQAARSMPIHTHFPEAICIYPQGVKTPGQITDPKGEKNGWQFQVGDHEDRDLHFFDTMLEWAKKEFQVDGKRIYATGHSNGASFTYLLLASRGDTFAAIAPSSGVSMKYQKEFKPKPVLHIMGETDPLVPMALQKRAVDSLRKTNGVEPSGKPWHDVKYASVYESKSGTPVVTLIYPGDHTYYKDAPAAIARFFHEHPAK
ncbi:MAG: prolyl oligopeptidase family serine peptidase [Gemmataceae bacterium]